MSYFRAYFIGCEGTSYVKIGKGNVEQRCHSLQKGCPFELSILGATNKFSEAELHKQFSHLRIRDEWFKLDDELSKIISNCESCPSKKLGIKNIGLSKDLVVRVKIHASSIGMSVKAYVEKEIKKKLDEESKLLLSPLTKVGVHE